MAKVYVWRCRVNPNHEYEKDDAEPVEKCPECGASVMLIGSYEE